MKDKKFLDKKQSKKKEVTISKGSSLEEDMGSKGDAPLMVGNYVLTLIPIYILDQLLTLVYLCYRLEETSNE